MRKPRQYSQTGFYHIVNRGVNKQNIFYDDEDRKMFISLLQKYAKKFKIKIHSFILMENHMHLEIEDIDGKISLFMQTLQSVYARFFNNKYDRVGHLFQERFTSEVILTNDYFLTVLRYILQNSEKAGLCKASQYKWSSYKLYRKKKTFVTTDLILELLGSIEGLCKFIQKYSEDECIDIGFRPSEKRINLIQKIKKLLKTDNPIVNPELPLENILEKVRILRENHISIRNISRITGISIGIILKV